MNIWHICCTSGNMCNGMVQVIPEHVNNQAAFANVLLINLAEYTPKVNKDIPVYNIYEFNKIGFNNLADEKGKPDIIVIHGIYLPKLWGFWNKYIHNKIPYVVIPHGSLTRQTQNRHRAKKMIGNFIIVKRLVKNAALLQYLSQGEKNVSINMRNRNIYIGPNGIYAGRSVKIKHELKHNEIKLIYIGRYDLYSKGIDILLEACSLNKNMLKNNNVKIYMYGKKEGSDYEEISTYVNDNELSDIVSVNGPVFDDEKKDKYLSGTYFLLTSRTEGLPMGFLEACSYGLPVLITETTNMGMDVREFSNGFVADCSIEGISDLFRFAINNMSMYKEMSDGSLECANKYDWEAVARDAVRAYTKCLDIKE